VGPGDDQDQRPAEGDHRDHHVSRGVAAGVGQVPTGVRLRDEALDAELEEARQADQQSGDAEWEQTAPS